MIIKWLGHSCFLLTNEDGDKLIIDPYDSYVGKEMSKVGADVAVVSHNHKDHCAVNIVQNLQRVIDKEGEFWYNKINIKTLYRYHDNKGGTLRGKTLITKIITDGLTLCHLGDIGEDCTTEVVSQIGVCNILFIPVGGRYTIDSIQAKAYVESIKPNIVIPMHYKTKYCVFDIDKIEKFVEKFDKTNILKLQEKQLIVTNENFEKGKLNIILMEIA